MIKGGFQGLDISGVDLTAQSPTLPGGYAACQAADGKTVLVLTAAGVVQCSVKKVSTNYVLAGITGDGKILSITIGSTDGISVSEMTPANAEEPEESLDGAVNISSATSSEPYITQYDGIVRLAKSSSATLSNSVELICKGGAAHDVIISLASLPVDTLTGTKYTCFVKKGTFLFCTNFPSAGVSLNFYPYKPVES